MRTKDIDLDDIGIIGIGRPMTEEETRLASEHIQAYMAKHPAPKRKPTKRGSTDKQMREAVKARPSKAKGVNAKLSVLDDIGSIGGGRPYTDEDARVVSAYIQAAKAKRAAGMKKVKPSRAKRTPSVKA